MIVVCLFLAVPRVCLQFVIVVFHGHAHLLFYLADEEGWLLYFKCVVAVCVLWFFLATPKVCM